MEYEIRFCTTPDNAQLAYATFGKGPALVVPPSWVSLLDLDSEDSWSLPFWKELAKYFTVLLYDKHGCGLSDRDRTDFSFEKEVRDLESIIECSQFEWFAFFGYSESGTTSIAYATKYPERVSHLIIYGSYRCGALIAPPKVKSALINLILAHWGLGSKMLTDLFIPDADKKTFNYANRFQQKSATAEMAASLSKAEDNFDVTNLLPDVKAPALVIHRKGDRIVPSKFGRELAALIPNAKFLLLDGNNHPPWTGDSDRIVREIINFIGLKEFPKSEILLKEPLNTEKEFKRKLAAIMSADVEGYSRLMDQDEEKTIHTLTSHRLVISDCVQQFRGRVVDTPGDNILSEFNSVIDAVKSAVKVQSELSERNAELPIEQRMKFRIGINLGDVVEEEGRIYGDGVNIAARIPDFAEGGGICISGSVYDQIENKLSIIYKPMGEQAVKNITKPVRVYKIIMESEDSS